MGGGGKDDGGKESGILSDLKPFNKKGFLATTLGFNKPKKPKPATPPEVVKPEDASVQAKLAADKKKKQAIGAYGYSDTNLTGGKLGAPPAANLNYNTVLGG